MKRLITLCFALLTIIPATAMFSLDFDITIGRYQLQALEKVNIETSQELLSDSCIITLPSMVAGRAIRVEDKIKKGDPVTVKLGYNGELKTEFKGYLKAIYPESPMRLECEDSAYLFRKVVKSKILRNVSIKEILEYVLSEVNPQLSQPFGLVSDLSNNSYKWDAFTIHNATGFEVLDKLRQESGLMIYVRDNKLHYHLAYTEITGQVIYDFAENIEVTSNLKYVSGQDLKTRVIVVGRTAKGTKVEGEAGESGGDVITLQRPTVSDKTTLENIAREELKKLSYDGFRGNIDSWLVPYCTTGHSCLIRDKEYPLREGRYYAVGTQVEFSQNGGFRSVAIGARLG